MERILNEKGCLFMVFEKGIIEKLKELPVEKVFVTGETIEKIKSILSLSIRSNEELIAARNTVVRELTKDDNDMDNWTRMSMITCVIDDEKHKRGMIF